MKDRRNAGFIEESLPTDAVATPVVRLTDAWYRDIDQNGEPAAAHELAVLALKKEGYTFDEIDSFCEQRDKYLEDENSG